MIVPDTLVLANFRYLTNASKALDSQPGYILEYRHRPDYETKTNRHCLQNCKVSLQSRKQLRIPNILAHNNLQILARAVIYSGHNLIKLWPKDLPLLLYL